MQIPMEILSLTSTRTDSGADPWQRTSIADKIGSIFGKVLDESRAAMDNHKIKDVDKTGNEILEEDIMPKTPRKPDKNTDEDDALVAGVVGYQNTIVFILEGDKESATTPEITVDVVSAAETNCIEEIITPSEEQRNTVDTEPEQTAADMNAEETVITAGDVEDAAEAGVAAEETGVTAETSVAVEADVTAEASITADVKTEANVKTTAGAGKTPVAEPTDAGNEADSAAGEVTARRPVIGTTARQENEENDSGFSEDGDLSPLENENNRVPVKGHKEKTYSETENDAKETFEGARETVVDQPLPLAVGIKPEQFQADQQMVRAADVPVRKENLFDEMVSRIETMTTENEQKVVIQLKPEFMGKVALEIAMDAAGLHVRINAANSDIRGMINGQINALIESLGNKGIEIAEVEVAYTGVDNGAFSDSQKNQAQPNHQKRSQRVDGIEDDAAYFAALKTEMLEYYLDAGLSSVEFSA